MGSRHGTEHREETISDGLGQLLEQVSFPGRQS